MDRNRAIFPSTPVDNTWAKDTVGAHEFLPDGLQQQGLLVVMEGQQVGTSQLYAFTRFSFASRIPFSQPVTNILGHEVRRGHSAVVPQTGSGFQRCQPRPRTGPIPPVMKCGVDLRVLCTIQKVPAAGRQVL